MDVRNLLLLGVAIRCLDGGRMQIKSTEFRFRECFRHDEGGDAMTASDVRDTSAGAQLLLDAVKRGYPLLVYVGLITGPKEPLYPAKKAVVMHSPRQTSAGPKTLAAKSLTAAPGPNPITPSLHRPS